MSRLDVNGCWTTSVCCKMIPILAILTQARSNGKSTTAEFMRHDTGTRKWEISAQVKQLRVRHDTDTDKAKKTKQSEYWRTCELGINKMWEKCFYFWTNAPEAAAIRLKFSGGSSWAREWQTSWKCRNCNFLIVLVLQQWALYREMEQENGPGRNGKAKEDSSRRRRRVIKVFRS